MSAPSQKAAKPPRRLEIANHRVGRFTRVEILPDGLVRVTEVWDEERGWVKPPPPMPFCDPSVA